MFGSDIHTTELALQAMVSQILLYKSPSHILFFNDLSTFGLKIKILVILTILSHKFIFGP